MDLRCDHCKDWAADKWSIVQAHMDKLQEHSERKAYPSLLFLAFDPNDRPIPVSEFYSSHWVTC